MGYGIAEALPGVRVESPMVMVVVVCLGMRRVIMVVRRCFSMGLAVVIMPGLGLVIVTMAMPRLFGADFEVAVIVLVVECDRLDPFGRHHARAIELGGVDQPIQPTLELQPVEHKDLRFADGARSRPRFTNQRTSGRFQAARA